jgi:hypothetical protein
MTTPPETARAYAEFIAAAGRARAALLASRPDRTALDDADGELFLAGLIEGAMQFVLSDAARPAFIPWVSPTRRWMDNGRDSVYWMAPVDGSRRYRISGRRGDECYLSFTLYSGDPGHPQHVVANWNHRDLAVAAGDSYTFEVDPPADACYVISRQYFDRPLDDNPGTFTVEALGAPRSAPGAGALATRWRAATAFLTAMTAPPRAGGPPPAYVSTVPNVMGDPSVWKESEGGGRGTPDQTYALGPYALAADQMLELDLVFPPCAYAGVALWNRYSQTVDRRFHCSTLNHREVVVDPDGHTRIVVAHRDPGAANWLDTGGRTRGTLFFRFLLAESAPQHITSTVKALPA